MNKNYLADLLVYLAFNTLTLVILCFALSVPFTFTKFVMNIALATILHRFLLWKG